MGILDRVKSDLEYRAERGATDGVVKGAKKLVKREGKANKCPKCGKPIQPGVKFCTNCGNKFVATCIKCNVDYPAGTKFCAQCGEPVK
jgi:membrane protease subunit (stomatin/prohibitin family)